MLRLGVSWDEVIDEAEIPESQRYGVPSRWGKNPRQMAKVLTVLQEKEAHRKTPTEDGKRILGLAEWEELGRAISRVPELFNRELERLRPVAAGANKIADGKDAEISFLSPTPEPKRSRK